MIYVAKAYFNFYWCQKYVHYSRVLDNIKNYFTIFIGLQESFKWVIPKVHYLIQVAFTLINPKKAILILEKPEQYNKQMQQILSLRQSLNARLPIRRVYRRLSLSYKGF